MRDPGGRPGHADAALAPDPPKTLMPVAGIPFAHYQLSWLARHGVTEVVYSIGFQGELVRDYVGDGRRWGLGPVRRGRPGAARHRRRSAAGSTMPACSRTGSSSSTATRSCPSTFAGLPTRFWPSAAGDDGGLPQPGPLRHRQCPLRRRRRASFIRKPAGGTPLRAWITSTTGSRPFGPSWSRR